MDNKLIFNCVREMVKQFEKIENEDTFRENSIELIKNVFGYDYYTAEVTFDLAYFGEWAIYENDNARYILSLKDNIVYCLLEDSLTKDYQKIYKFNSELSIQTILDILDKME